MDNDNKVELELDDEGNTHLQQMIIDGQDISEYVKNTDKESIAVNNKNNFGDSALHMALGADPFDPGVLISLLNIDGIDVKIKDRDGYTPLFRAVDENNLPAVEVLVKQSDIDINQQFDDGNTVLHIALIADGIDFGIAQTIFDARKDDINFEVQNNKGQTVKSLLPLELKLEESCKTDDVNNDLQQDIINNQDINHKDKVEHVKGDDNKLELDDNGRTPLQQIILEGHDVLSYIGSSEDIAINHKDNFGQTALHLVITREPFYPFHLAALLSVDNLNVNITDRDGNTPLSLAVKRKSCMAVDLLINRRKDLNINIQLPDGNTALHLALLASELGYDRDVESIVNLIIKNRSDIDYTLKNKEGQTVHSLLPFRLRPNCINETKSEETESEETESEETENTETENTETENTETENTKTENTETESEETESEETESEETESEETENTETENTETESEETYDGNNKLQQAIINGEAIEGLVKNMSANEINHKNNAGKTALHLAAAHDGRFDYNYVFILSQHKDLDATIVDNDENPAMYDCIYAHSELFFGFLHAREIVEKFNDMDKDQDSSMFSFFKSDPIKGLKNDVVKLTKKITALNDLDVTKNFKDLCTDSDNGVLRELIDYNRHSKKQITQTRKTIDSLLAPKSGCGLFA